MLRKTLLSFSLAVSNIRSNLFHTVLSVLGIVIGVGALVAILSFIDGMERFARAELTRTTNVNAVVVRAERYKMVNGLRVARDTAPFLDYAAFRALTGAVSGFRQANLQTEFPVEFQPEADPRTLAAMLIATSRPPWPDTTRMQGRAIDSIEYGSGAGLAVINSVLARQLDSVGGPAAAVGRVLRLKGRTLTVVGVAPAEEKVDDEQRPKLFVPVGALLPAELRQEAPTLVLEAISVEAVQPLKTAVEAWLQQRYGAGQTDFAVYTNEYRVEQLAKGFLLFRIVMGLIVGISVVVGGVGIMNVLLISVTERTAEIGLRKAVGARNGDILRLFLSESIAVSAFGSMLGLVFGIAVTAAAMPIVRALTDLPFQAAYTWSTFLTIALLAVAVGIVFGTYPAMKAARLDPVEALRRE